MGRLAESTLNTWHVSLDSCRCAPSLFTALIIMGFPLSIGKLGEHVFLALGQTLARQRLGFFLAPLPGSYNYEHHCFFRLAANLSRLMTQMLNSTSFTDKLGPSEDNVAEV